MMAHMSISTGYCDPQSPYDTSDASSDDGDQLQTPLTDDHDNCAFDETFHNFVKFPPFEHSDAHLRSPERFRMPHAPYPFSSPLQNFTSRKKFNPDSFLPLRSAPTYLPRQTKALLELDPFADAFLQGVVCTTPSPLNSLDQRRLSCPSIQSTSSSPPSANQPAEQLHTAERTKFKFVRSAASEFVPITLASTYSSRFELGHHLRKEFIRTYQLGVELGSGGYGFVMTAYNRFKRNQVAVKFIYKDKVPANAWAFDDHGRSVPMEAKLLSLVKHDGIVKFLDLFEDELYFYLVQELHGTPWIKSEKTTPLVGVTASSTNAIVPPLISSTPCPSSPACQGHSEKFLRDEPCAQLYDPPQSAAGQHHSGKILEDNNPNHSSNVPELREKPDVRFINPASLVKPEFTRRPSHDLFECIEQSKHKRLSEQDARHIFAQVVDIVEYMDSEGITHRDIKDENLVIDKHLKVKLIDFGSVVIADPTQPRPYYDLFYGTTAYASSEILLKKAYQAPPAEIWTLGVLLSYLLTGASPFPSEQHAIEGCVVLDKSSGAKVSRSCLDLMRRCLEADPNKRITIKEVKVHPWLADAIDRTC